MQFTNRIINRANREIYRRKKNVLQRLSLNQSSDKKIVLVAGCQRSGTSMTYKIFDRDPRSQVFDEISILSNKDKIENLRLNNLETVKERFEKSPADFIVAKPLVESQRLKYLLDYFPRSSALWMFRHYIDVVSSNLVRFGQTNGYDDIKPIIENDESNWRCEHLSSDVKDLIVQLSKGCSEADAAALFWYARNSLLFQQKLQEDARVYICQYEDLVSDPTRVIRGIYQFFDLDISYNNLQEGISPKSIGKGSNIEISTEIKAACDEMYRNLLSVSRSHPNYPNES